jgi:hypothetical protein
MLVSDASLLVRHTCSGIAEYSLRLLQPSIIPGLFRRILGLF